MDVKHSGLLAELFAMNVIDQRDKEELESIDILTCRIERLLSMLSKTSSDQWEQFLEALDKTGQRHLADIIRGKQTEEFPGSIIVCSFVHRAPIVSSTMDVRHHTMHAPSSQSVGRKHPCNDCYAITLVAISSF